ncbi:hypothetical protein ACTXT7_009422 [Hymenolepis weldensis]
MQCVQNRKLVISERRPTNVHSSMSVHEPVLKTDYVRKITADAFMVGSLPTPQSLRVPPGIIRSTESHNCTYTTNSGLHYIIFIPERNVAKHTPSMDFEIVMSSSVTLKSDVSDSLRIDED